MLTEGRKERQQKHCGNNIRRLEIKIGIGIDVHKYDKELLQYIEIANLENPLYPKKLYENNDRVVFPCDHEVIVDGAYIDINPAVEEPDILEIVKMRIQESIDFAKFYNATEVLFLSTFIPDIKIDAYDDQWKNNSIEFWKEISRRNRNVRISICNTFEHTPKNLIDLVEGVNNSNFGLAMDIGHLLTYSKISIEAQILITKGDYRENYKYT